MREFDPEESAFTLNMQTVLQMMRAAGALMGIIVILVGLVYATRVFNLVIDTLRSPGGIEAHIETWAAAVGGEHVQIVINGTSYPCAQTLAVGVLGGGCFILAWLTMGLILTGAKTVSWTLSDREAIKRMLVHAFGAAKGSHGASGR